MHNTLRIMAENVMSYIVPQTVALGIGILAYFTHAKQVAAGLS